MRAAIFFLTWNRCDYTKKSLQSIIDNTNKTSYDLFLWDNNSTEPGMIDWLKRICLENNFYYVFHSQNIGLTTAMNWQMKIANSLNTYDVFCHIANDVVVPKNWLNAVFTAIKHEEVGLIGLNLEKNSTFQIQDFDDIQLEKLRYECNVGGMHFCIPKKVYDLIGGFRQVDYGYGQQDANYSLIVKLLPNNWWPFYLPKNEYHGEHLGLLNYEKIDDENKHKVLYKEYHETMVKRLKLSGDDKHAGRNYRNYLNLIKNKFLENKISYNKLINMFKTNENIYKPVLKNQILETNLDEGFFV